MPRCAAVPVQRLFGQATSESSKPGGFKASIEEEERRTIPGTNLLVRATSYCPKTAGTTHSLSLLRVYTWYILQVSPSEVKKG